MDFVAQVIGLEVEGGAGARAGVEMHGKGLIEELLGYGESDAAVLVVVSIGACTAGGGGELTAPVTTMTLGLGIMLLQ